MSTAQRIVITGAGRGLGLEFCRQWAAQGRQLAALVRDPGRYPELQSLAVEHPGLEVYQADVTAPASLATVAASLERRWGAVDLLCNNAGIIQAAPGGGGRGLGKLDAAELAEVYAVNAIGSLQVTEAFLPLLRAGDTRLIAHLTSRMGSIADNGSGGHYAYRMSKAALNMAHMNISHELRAERIASIVFHPGWVQTEMGGAAAPLTPPESVRNLIGLIDRAELSQSGSFLDQDGTTIPW